MKNDNTVHDPEFPFVIFKIIFNGCIIRQFHSNIFEFIISKMERRGIKEFLS